MAAPTPEQRRRAIAESVDDGIVEVDGEGVIRSFNAAAHRIFGYPAEDVVGRPVSQLMPEPLRPGHQEVVGSRKDGTPVRLGLTVRTTSVDTTPWFTVIARDLGEKARAEHEDDSFFELALDLFCIGDFTGYLHRVNPASTRTLGWSVEQLLERPVLEFVHPDDQAAALRELASLAGGSATVHFRCRCQHSDGSWRWLAWQAVPRPAERLFYATARDITDIQAAQDALRWNEKNLAVTLDSIGDGVLATDADGRITRLNRVAQDLTGWTEAEAAGRPVDEIFQIVNAVTRQPAHVPTADTLRHGTLHGLANDTILIARDGTETPIADSCAPILSDGDAIVGSVLVFRDVTTEYAARRALRAHDAKMAAHARELGAVVERLNQVLESAPNALLIVDSDGRITLANAQAEQLFGYPRTDLIGRLVDTLVPERHRSGHAAHRHGFAADPNSRPMGRGRELFGVHRDGREIPLEIGLSPVVTRDGTFVLASIVDISERRRMEGDLRMLSQHLDEMVSARTADLQASERRFYHLFEFAPDALVQTNGQGVIVGVNRQAERLFGWTREELTSQPVEILMPGHGRTGDPTLRQAFIDTAVPRPMGGGASNLRAVRKDGSEFPIEISLSPIDTDTGRHVVAAVRDITDRRAMEESLRQSEEQYRQLVEGASEVFYKVATPDDPLRGQLEFMSRSVVKQTGRQPEDFIRDPSLWITSLHPDDLPSLAASTRNAVSSRTTIVRSYRLRHTDGTYRAIEDTITPVVGADGSVIGYTGVARDVSERLRLEAQLLHSQRTESVGRLAGGIAHDFNNLLTVILGTVDLALSGLAEADPLSADLREVRSAGARAAELTRQLLAYSRRLILQPTVLNFNAVLQDMLSLLRRLLPENIAIEFVPSADLHAVKADRGQLEQVIVNLAVNARDAMLAGGTLTFETRNVVLDQVRAAEHASIQPGPHVMLSVSDTGIGMSEATRREVFEPFFTTKDPGKGTGLGLATVDGIIRQSGGSISVISEVGRGSTFMIYLPQATDAASADRPIQKAETSRGSETILIVEDEGGVRRLATRLLRSAGYTVLVASNADEALRILEQQGVLVHLVVTDVVMPGLSGPDLAGLIATRYPAVKILFTSGYTDDAIGHHGVLDGGMHLLNKPYTALDLTSAVRAVLDS